MGSWLSSRPKNDSNLSGKVVVITGGRLVRRFASDILHIYITTDSRGIGLETARQLYELGAIVYIGVRTEEKAKSAIQQIQAVVAESIGQLKWFPLDLSTIKRSRESAEEFLKMERQLDILS